MTSQPFLTVITRTQGRRPTLLAETLGGLAVQTDQEFEILVVRHRVTPEQAAVVQRVVDDLPDGLRSRTRVIDSVRPGRSSPLNDGFEAARGDYVAVLDDDDLALPNWVATFHAMAPAQPGRVLRTVAVRQPVKAIHGSDGPVAVPAGDPDRLWPAEFHFLDHLLINHTPPVALAFPRPAFSELGERFDEALDTTEDWDFLMRVANRVGVASSPVETCIYRWWVASEGSRAKHGEAEWKRNEAVVRAKLDDLDITLPRGSVTRLQALLSERDEQIATLHVDLARESRNAQRLLSEARAYLARAEEAEASVRRLRHKVRRLREKLGE